MKKQKQTQTESQLWETVNYVDWFSDVKCYIVYFILKQFPQLECSIETTPCGDRPIFPCKVTLLVGHSDWICFVPFPGPLLLLIICQTHQFSTGLCKCCPPCCYWRMTSLCPVLSREHQSLVVKDNAKQGYSDRYLWRAKWVLQGCPTLE